MKVSASTQTEEQDGDGEQRLADYESRTKPEIEIDEVSANVGDP